MSFGHPGKVLQENSKVVELVVRHHLHILMRNNVSECSRLKSLGYQRLPGRDSWNCGTAVCFPRLELNHHLS